MNKPSITHLILDTSSSAENYSGDCDYVLVPMTAIYVADLLGYMDEVVRLHKADDSVYNIECWDATPSYFRLNDRMEAIRDIGGDLAVEVPRGDPILLTADPRFKEADFQRVDCRTVQVATDEVWWTAYVKHSGIRIESAQIQKKTLLRIQRSFGIAHSTRPAKPKPSHQVARRIHDLLYLDMKNGREFYSPDKNWDADVLDRVAEIVAEFIPRPPQIES